MKEGRTAMNIFGVDLSERPALIAEIGVNHEGSLDKALELLNLAADAGADAVKFQSYTAERFIAADDAERRARVARFGLDEAAHLTLKAAAAERGIAFCSSAISEDWVPFLATHCAAIKIASGDIDRQAALLADRVDIDRLGDEDYVESLVSKFAAISDATSDTVSTNSVVTLVSNAMSASSGSFVPVTIDIDTIQGFSGYKLR